MKIKIDTQLNAADGKPLFFPKMPTVEEFIDSLPTELKLKVLPFYIAKDKTPRLLKDVCLDTILLPVETDDEKVKMNKYDIYKKLFAAKTEADLTAEDLVVLKKAVGKFQPQLIMGQVFELIEGGAITEKTKTKKE